MTTYRIALASDHAGYPLKRKLAGKLADEGHVVEDFGCHGTEAADLSDFAAPAAAALGEGRFDRALFVDGAGYPSGMVANMFSGVFAAVCNDPVSTRFAREHGGANALCIGAMIIGEAMAQEILRIFLTTEALGGKYAARREKVAAIGERQRLGPLHRTRRVVTIDDLKRAIERKEPLVLGPETVLSPSVIEGVRGLHP